MSSDSLANDQLEIQEKPRNPWLNWKLGTAAGVLALAVAFLIFNAMDGSAAFYMTVDELHAEGANVQGQQVKVGGDVVDGSIERGGIGEEIRFEISNGGESIPVVYDGDVPDIFADHAEVIATGTMRSDGVFEANELLTKCPSRFEAEEGVSK